MSLEQDPSAEGPASGAERTSGESAAAEASESAAAEASESAAAEAGESAAAEASESAAAEASESAAAEASEPAAAEASESAAGQVESGPDSAASGVDSEVISSKEDGRAEAASPAPTVSADAVVSGSGEAREEEDPTRGPAAQIALAVALTLGLIGFVTGLSQPKLGREHQAPTPQAGGPALVPIAPRYAELRETNLGPNAEWTNGLEKLPSLRPDLFAPREPAGLSAKSAGLAARATRRAYAGAPPTIPHQVSSRSAASCLSCHAEGQQVGDRVASPMPHALLVNCLQCHAPPAPDALSESTPGVAPNQFEGQAEPLAGDRAGVGSPPVIPHATRMRENCVACHGPQGSAPALRTTHPWRVNCRQCHAAATAGFAK